MRQLVLSIVLLSSFYSNVVANGVCVVNAETGTYFRLLSTHVDVVVENQVAIITASQTFKNETGSSQNYKYAFPLTEEESAIGLRWFVGGVWNEAVIEPSPQDTTLPGGGGDSNYQLEAYLGETPLFFEIEDPVANDSVVVVELSYVNLLQYENGNVYFSYPNDYSLIQSAYLDAQEISFTLNSVRSFDDLVLSSHSADSSSNDGHLAYLECSEWETPASQDFEIQYMLSLDELGLFGLSTFLPDSLVPDQGDHGFFVFVAEPDPENDTDVINKVFTLIIDRSGSMGGNKIIQARNAATFIINNLNQGDRFNIVDFSSDATEFRAGHVDFTPTNQEAAVQYIAGINAGGGTNISESFGVAIPDFAAANDSTANIIIFFTDGQATQGITETQGILNHVDQLTQTAETELMIFSFGIGEYANEQLLTILAASNNGLAEFLGNDEVEDRITAFYLRIRNPVLLNTSMSFSPDVIAEAFPSPLPSLYQGQQMIVAGRFNQASTVDITLEGEAFGQPVSYSYGLPLPDSANVSYQFLPKIWAKKKIENLLIQFYSLPEGSPEAESLRNEIITLSLNFGVITPFTSFVSNPTSFDEIADSEPGELQGFELIGNYPNPFNPSTTIMFRVESDVNRIATVKIYNALGQVVKILYTSISSPGIYEVHWDGRLENGQLAPSGSYFYLVDFGDTILGGKMTLLK
ncbi:MAG: VWA domain-containing protein [Candidatus Marinimicrobia bacterium]|nr:VWA domain-containing protein [Candidatus Neomarinimicrobiota bacterium]